ncbi:MAG: hypothetical protein AAF789_06855 [Bacteroidota bacterium]
MSRNPLSAFSTIGARLFSFWCLSFVFSFQLKAQVRDHSINATLSAYGIGITTLSFHLDGSCLISPDENPSDGSRHLLLIKNWGNDGGDANIDTLDDRDPGYSTFSKDGKSIVYSIKDENTISHTLKRTFHNGRFGQADTLNAFIGVPNMLYYSMDSVETIYFYVWFGEGQENGLYFSTKSIDGTYMPKQLIFADDQDMVPFSPLILDSRTMVFFQHGILDDSNNGAYYSRFQAGSWSSPKLIEELPYGASFSYGPRDQVVFIDNDGKVLEIDKEALLELLD